MIKRCGSALVLISSVSAGVYATPFDNAAMADAAIRQVLLDVGHQCGVDATQQGNDWIVGVLNYGMNAEAKDSAIVALHRGETEVYQSAIRRFICP